MGLLVLAIHFSKNYCLAPKDTNEPPKLVADFKKSVNKTGSRDIP